MTTERWKCWAAVAAIGIAAFGIVLFQPGSESIAADASPAPSQVAACSFAIQPVAIDRASAARTLSKVPAYTQGLIFVDGSLYESTGQTGHSAIYRLSPENGDRTELVALDQQLFGEGLAKFGDRFFQLTWRAGLVFAYELDGLGTKLARTQTFRHDGEGWGLTALANELVLSDGSDQLFFIDPDTFETTRQKTVRLGEQPVPRLNELELVGDTIFANVYGDSSIIGIDPETGCVTAVIDTRRLVAEMTTELESLTNSICNGPCSAWDFVVNGIAYDPQEDELYITGKNWPRIFVYRGLIGRR